MNIPFLRQGVMLAALPIAALAQTTTPVTPTTPAQPMPAETAPINYGPMPGRFEFTLGGSGASNKDFDSSLGGVNFSVGTYFTDTLLGSVRQSINYSNPDNAEDSWGGSTFLALDHHFGTGSLRPLIGINFGRIYGDQVADTWAAGIEAGVKYYVQSRTFLYAMAQYAWAFEDDDDIDDSFDDGQVLWTVGIGFNF